MSSSESNSGPAPITERQLEFNQASGAYEAQLTPEEHQARRDLKTQYQDATRAHEERFTQDRDNLIGQEADRLTQTNELEQQMPRPSWAPPPQLRTRAEIEHTAQQHVDRQHEREGDERAWEATQREEDHLTTSVGKQVVRDEEPRARKEAFMRRRQAQREQDRDQGRGR